MISPQLASPISNKFRLRTAIVIPFVLQVAAAVGLVAYLSYRNGQESVNHLASQVRIEVASRTQLTLENYFKTPHQITKSNINALHLHQINFEDKESVERYFAAQLQIYPMLGEIFVGQPDGTMIYVGRKSDGNLLSATTVNVPNRTFYQLDSSGNRYKFEKKDSFDARTRPWYQAAVANKGQSWSSVYQSRTIRNLGTAAAEPYYDQQGNLVAVFANFILLQGISDFLTSLKISSTGQVFVMDRTGLLVATSTGENSFVPTGEDDKLKQIEAIKSQNLLTHNAVVQLQEKFGGFDRIQKLQELSFDIDGKRQYLLAQPYSDGKGLNLLVVVVVPEADFMEQIDLNTRNTILLSLAALGVVVLLGMVTSQLITAPILRVYQAANRLAQGDLAQKVPSSPIAEINELSKAFNKMSEQLKESFDTLEDKVRERTGDLAIANQEINVLNQCLQADNLRLGAELDIVRQMQRMILPNAEELEIEGLDIAAYMDAAADVGGDYYEVLNSDGVVTIGIGDVTGHGLESAILMLMTQTAVRTLKEGGDLEPVRFLDVLNRTLYKNVQRINSEKCLTLSILNYAHGKVSITGQHEEAIVVRKNGAIERIDTMDLGFPIALDGDIAGFIHQVMVELNHGDGLVLYTDGIPEACDINKKLYGVDRMCRIISEHWSLTSEEIKNAIIQDVRQYIGVQKVFDDITLLIFKRD
ncbi:SpoIIE family protein phosphatase [Pseudanabaena sp. 'Roaring Creek']|uniref:SpoIIE family protein phosphatase n=1 Tax=Pseudanabaena sp. 'Roaring Creek' TaxID=1681830 RepID=UPI0006D83281|nr:SpoIIE family protein phosphatase [Pseudanabaena sp. 'Roaring Creek']